MDPAQCTTEVIMKKTLMMVIPGFAVLMLFAACGSNSGSSDPGVAAVGTCSAGYVYSTSYGCIVQGSCPAGSGMYNNTCVPATASQCTTTTGYPTTGTYPYGYNGNNGYNGYNNGGINGSCGTTGTGYGYQNPGYVTYPNNAYPVYYGGNHHW